MIGLARGARTLPLLPFIPGGHLDGTMAPATATTSSPGRLQTSEEQWRTSLMIKVLGHDSGKVESSAISASSTDTCRHNAASNGECIFEKFAEALGFWEKIGTSPWWLSVIDKGYALHFERPFVPGPNFETNRSSAFRNSDFIDGEIAKLLQERVIREVKEEELSWVSPLMVVEGKKPRLILDLSFVNTFLAKTNFRLEDLSSIWDVLPYKGYMLKFDFRSGYHHVRIESGSQRFLGFSWFVDGHKKFFTYNAMPFGLSPAPFVFTKLFRPLVRKWRNQGIPVTLYLDDGLVFCETLEQCQRAASIVLEDLKSAGITIAFEKSVFVPQQKLDFLGFSIDLAAGKVHVSSDRVAKALERLRSLEGKSSPSVEDRRRFLGSVISMTLIVSDAVRASRATSSVVADAQLRGLPSFKNLRRTDKECEEWGQWRERLEASEVAKVIPEAEPDLEEARIYTDASAFGVGALYQGEGVTMRASDRFTVEERAESSTLRELKGALFAARVFKDQLSKSNAKIIFFLDNQAAVAILRKGSMKRELQEVALGVESIRIETSSEFEFRWLPREENEEADELSRERDWGDWGIKQELFEIAQNRWGHFTVDLFADEHSAKCKRFVSRFLSPGAAAVDAFSQSHLWYKKEFIWCVPPPALIGRVLFFARRYGSRGVLGMPKWVSHPAWPRIVDENGKFRSFVKDTLEFGAGARILIPSRSGAFAFRTEFTASPFIFILFDFPQRA